jgi:Uma2 family endonuclease
MKRLIAKERSADQNPVPGFHRNAISKVPKKIIYPDSDGKPMADNTKQFNWIIKIKENLELMYQDDPEVFIGGDLLWYPIEGNNKLRVAPDAMVVFGRPKGDRGSYRTWEENDISPQVVFEIMSPGNTRSEMDRKFQFYQTYGVEEYYIYDPDRIRLTGWIRTGKEMIPIANVNGWTSPRLNIRFELTADDLIIYRPDGIRFLSTIEQDKISKTNRQMAEAERQRAEAAIRNEAFERKRAEAERQRAEAERQRAEAAIRNEESERKRAEAERREKERLLSKLRELGVEI